jgi:hypothetical protein
MTINSLATTASVWVAFTAVIILVSRNWRVSVSAIGAQFLGVFLLISLSWPIEYAIIKLVAGWIAAAVLGMGLGDQTEVWDDELGSWVSGTLFRIFLAGFIIFMAIVLTPTVVRLILRASNLQVFGALSLIGLGLVHLGLTAQPTRIILGLLTVLSGFEIIYATMETSLLVNALLAVNTLGLALIGAYLNAVSQGGIQE